MLRKSLTYPLFFIAFLSFLCNGQDAHNCDDSFSHPGAPGSIGNNVDHTDTLCPDPTCPDLLASVIFDFITMETNFDYVRVYDGNNIGAPLLATYTGSHGMQTVTASSAGGCLLVRTTTDASVFSTGFDASFSCNDIVAPVFTTCPGNQTGATNANCEFFIPDYTGLATVTDGCAFSLTQAPSPGTLVTAGTHIITLTADDGYNQTNCNFDVVVSGQAGPIPVPSVSTTSTCVNTSVSFSEAGSNIDTWLWDFGDGNTSTQQNPTHVYTDTGTYNVTLVASNTANGCSQTISSVGSITVHPPIATFTLNPSIGCAIPHTVFFTDQSTLPDTWFWDFGDGNTSTLQNPVHTYTSTGNFTVTLTVTDTIFGCSDVATSQVSVNIQAADFSANTTFGCGPLTVNFTDASIINGPAAITDWLWDFGDGNTSTQQNPTHTYQTPGVYSVSLTTTLANGCTDTETKPAYIQVIGPDVNFGADTTYGCPPSTVNFTDSTVFGAPITSWTWDFGDGNSSNLQNPTHVYTTYGLYDVALTVVDIDGCSRTHTINSYIDTEDNIDPTISCPGNQNVNFDAACQFTLPDYTGMATTNDDCGAITLTQSPAIGTVISGIQTVTITATDGAGNTASCTFDVIPSDNTNPSISCPGNISQNNDLGQCSAVVTYTAPIGTDNCSGATTAQTAGLPSGSSFPIGTTTNTFVVTDAAGNTATCSFDVIITDNENPSISCPADINQNNDAGQCGAVVTYTVPVGTDNCAGVTTNQLAGLPSGSTFPVGTTTNTFEVTDAVGNTSTCSFDVIITDNENPNISCPTDILQNIDPGTCGAVVNYTAPIGSDNCPGASTNQIAGLPSGSTFPLGTTTNSFEVTDAAGNSISCSFDVIITDNENPTITCPADISQNNDVGQCGALVTFTSPVGIDNCAGATTSQIAGLPSGSNFPVGITTNTFQVTDAAGNMTSCSFDVTISDIENPSITCPANISTCDSIISFPNPSVLDNCTGVSFVLSSGLASGSSFPAGITTNTYTATDAGGNTATCSVDITRYQTPIINAGPDASIDAGFSHPIDATSSNVQSYDWSPSSSLDDNSIENPVASPTETTTYMVTVVSPDGCINSDEITITVNQEIEVNNFMSPNGDGRNDTWIIKGNYLLDFCKIQIMDSWGNILFESTGYNNSWDGTHNGKKLPDGNYYYVISCDGDEPLTGAITLIR